jgi:hypothetical protein
MMTKGSLGRSPGAFIVSDPIAASTITNGAPARRGMDFLHLRG